MKKSFAFIALALIACCAFATDTPANSKMLTDKNGAIIPQYWDSSALVYRVISPAYPMPNAAPDVTVIANNITQFGGTNLSTGTGAGGAGIPRVTVSNDSVVGLAGYSYRHVATSTNTAVKSGTGTLHAISVNTKGTVASAITVYDGLTCTGTVVAIIDSLTLSGIFSYDLNFATGLCVTTTGTAAPDITVLYK